MNTTLRQLLFSIFLLGALALNTSAAAEETTVEHSASDTAQAAAELAADAAEKAADEAVESLKEETKLDLKFSLTSHDSLSVAAR